MEINQNAYKVELSDIYSGPLDLLLYLIKKEEVAIHEVSISRITAQYIEYLEILKWLDVNIASEFLVTAATLMHIKAKSLLPIEEDDELDDEDDPQFELIKQLLEYKRYKDLSQKLGENGEDFSKRFPRPKINYDSNKDDDVELELNDISVWDLFEKFSNLMKETYAEEPRLIKDDDKPISKYMDELMIRFSNSQTLFFHTLFTGIKDKITMIGFFLALLELARVKRVKIEQDKTFDRIKISKNMDTLYDKKGDI